MKKIWLFLIPLLCSLLSCEGFTTTGSNDPYSNHCYGISKKNAYSYMFFFELNCPYGETCKTKMNFLGSGVGDTLDGRCFSGYELRLETADTSRTVLENKNYPISLTPENHAKFSLVDEDNVEKKYDIDLSGIIHSYTVRDDSVEVKSFDCLNRMVIYRYRVAKSNGPHDIIDLYPDSLRNGKYVFYQDDLLFDEIYFSCSLGIQNSFKTDSVYIHGDLYWR